MPLVNLEWPEPPPNLCKGLVFRGRLSHYAMRQGGVAREVKMIKMHRKSCPGCEQCGGMQDDLHQLIQEDAVIFPDVVDGQLYCLKYINITKDWESGIVDGYDLEFVRIPQ